MADIRNVQTEALECRDNRCQWEHIRKLDGKHPKYWGTYRHDLCVRCGNVRQRIENSDGSIAQNCTTYEYTPEYEKALKFTREDARKELNRRAKAKQTRVVRGTRGKNNLRVVS